MKTPILTALASILLVSSAAKAGFVHQDCRKENGGNPRALDIRVKPLGVLRQPVDAPPGTTVVELREIGLKGCEISLEAKDAQLVGEPASDWILSGHQEVKLFDQLTKTYVRVGTIGGLPGEIGGAFGARMTLVLDDDVIVKKSMRRGTEGYSHLADTDWERTTRELDLRIERNGVKHRIGVSERFSD